MNSTASSIESITPSYTALAGENALLREQVQVMQRQLDWFKKQLFGPKSEKQVYDLPQQDSLFNSNTSAENAAPAELTGPNADQYEVIGTKTTYRLAQRAASYLVLKHERPVIRRKGSENKPVTTAAAFNVLRCSRAHPASQVGELTPRLWKTRYADKPLRSWIDVHHPDRINEQVGVIQLAH